MKAKLVTYWICTGLISAMMLIAGFKYLTHDAQMMSSFAKLGYPEYFPNILGVAKILGVITLLAPRFPLLKEWAYAGFTITFVAAFISHMVTGDTGHVPAPFVALVLLGLSYFFRPPSRRLVAVVPSALP